MTTCYAALREALLVVRDADDTDSDLETSAHLDGHDVEGIDVGDGTACCATFDDGLFRTADGGETWTRASGLPDSVTAIVAGGRPGEWWAGTEPSAVYRSGDDGRTWERRPGLTDLPSASSWSFPPRPHTHHVRWIEPDPADPDHLYVGVEAGALVRTRDGGETWEDRVPSARRDNHSLATHPDAPGRAWAAAGDGYAETADGGETWDHPHDGLDHRYCWSVAVESADPTLVLLSSAQSARVAHNADRAESYLYRRRGDGAWERLDGRGVPTGEGVLRAVLARGDSAGVFYALHNRGLYRTADGGDSWARLGVSWSEAFERQTPRGLAVGE
ncbi:hypothetical protein SAMN04488063_0486 [Halopelagius inordinatus]|uniref:BNR/Asp-box repeat-containing protein n=1 Tax=Halopelagius inordinatus TaxID=553467 RepID=A0A1I2LXX4_9EURY|nr:hypothetical protein [Halopelagius inordinatus]SFF84073.1 hypothetical protein SAMN04488063_0486 [Halopelagius inordinatus]